MFHVEHPALPDRGLANLAGQDRHCRRRDPWDPGRLSERGRANLGEPLHHLTRQPRDALERKPLRDSPGLLATLTIDFGGLPSKVSFVLELGLDTGDVDDGVPGLHGQTELATLDQGAEPDFRVLQRPRRRDAFARLQEDS